MLTPDMPDAIPEITPLPEVSASRSPVPKPVLRLIVAVVGGLFLVLLGLIGYTILQESGLQNQEPPSFFEDTGRPLPESPVPSGSGSGIGSERNGAGDGGSGGNSGNGDQGNQGGSGSGGQIVACTMDAKICPDGTAVGRSGPNCEFSPCPGE